MGRGELSQLEGWRARLVVMPMLQWWDFRWEEACGKSLVCATSVHLEIWGERRVSQWMDGECGVWRLEIGFRMLVDVFMSNWLVVVMIGDK